MKFSSLFLFLAFVFSFSVSASAQDSECTLKLADSPTVRGFKLGMSQDEILKRFDGLLLPTANEFGVSRTRILKSDVIKDATKNPVFDGIDEIGLEFVDKKLSYFRIGYTTPSKRWTDANEFIKAVTTALKLPSSWDRSCVYINRRYSEENDHVYQCLPCNGFRIAAGLEDSLLEQHPYIKLEDTSATRLVDERAAAKRRRESEEKQRTFKP